MKKRNYKGTMLLIVIAAALSSTGCGNEVICEGGDACLPGAGGNGGSGGSGGEGGIGGTGGDDCGLCFKPTDCVSSCDGPIVQSSCCACPAGTFDLLECKPSPTPDLTDYCEDACTCMGCSSSEFKQCLSAVEHLTAQALHSGCENLLMDADKCLDAMQCKLGQPVLDPYCEEILEELQWCSLSGPPTVDSCVQAASICGQTFPDVPCEGQVECFADCVVQAKSCDIDTCVPKCS